MKERFKEKYFIEKGTLQDYYNGDERLMKYMSQEDISKNTRVLSKLPLKMEVFDGLLNMDCKIKDREVKETYKKIVMTLITEGQAIVNNIPLCLREREGIVRVETGLGRQLVRRKFGQQASLDLQVLLRAPQIYHWIPRYVYDEWMQMWLEVMMRIRVGSVCLYGEWIKLDEGQLSRAKENEKYDDVQRIERHAVESILDIMDCPIDVMYAMESSERALVVKEITNGKGINLEKVSDTSMYNFVNLQQSVSAGLIISAEVEVQQLEEKGEVVIIRVEVDDYSGYENEGEEIGVELLREGKGSKVCFSLEEMNPLVLYTDLKGILGERNSSLSALRIRFKSKRRVIVRVTTRLKYVQFKDHFSDFYSGYEDFMEKKILLYQDCQISMSGIEQMKKIEAIMEPLEKKQENERKYGAVGKIMLLAGHDMAKMSKNDDKEWEKFNKEDTPESRGDFGAVGRMMLMWGHDMVKLHNGDLQEWKKWGSNHGKNHGKKKKMMKI
jgi:hypothetical protein